MKTTTHKKIKRTTKNEKTIESDIARYSKECPWYRDLVAEIRETLSARDKCENGYRVTLPPQ
jgi:hypothetical protein